MKVIKLPDGTKKEVLDENNRYYITKDAQYRKINYADCIIEAEDKPKEEEKTDKKPAKKVKAVKKSDEEKE